MKDGVLNALRSAENNNRSDARLYETMVMEPQKNSSTPERIQNMVEFRDGLLRVADHALFKTESPSCLGCPSVLSCQDKCLKV